MIAFLKFVLLKTFHRLKINNRMYAYIAIFLSERSYKLKFGNNILSMKKQETGIRQGRVISPLLFVIALLDLQHIIKKSINYSLFVADLVIYLRSDSVQKIKAMLQNNIDKN